MIGSEGGNGSLSRQQLHDLRTPLNHIIGYSELLKDQATSEGHLAYMPDLERIHDAGRQLLSLLNGQPAVELPAASPNIAAKTSEGGAMILVVDDNEANRDVLSRRLQQQGHVVVTAANGYEALDVAHTQTFDMVMLDIMMPEMDGYETLRQFKADGSLSNIPVIMISAADDQESVIRCIEMGAVDFLPKPFDPILLKARTNACLENKRARDAEVKLFEELQASYKKLQQLEEQRDSLTHMIVHDLRTPLCSVISGLQTMPVMGELNSDQEEMMAIALEGGQVLLGMINGLLDVDKMESGAMQLDKVVLDARALLASATGQVAQLASSSNLTLKDISDEELTFFEGDEDVLRRVLVNLLGNAIKFTPAGGTVTTSATVAQGGKFLLFSVSDTGEGIPTEAFARIFEKFGQVESRQSGRLMSTGLGLTFCKLAVEAHGGRIDVDSTAGEGSCFFFTIPLKG